MFDVKSHILYEDPDILVIHKPAGIAVQSRNVLAPDLETLLRTYLASPYLGVIQRLDQPVEGLLVFAKQPKACSTLNGQIGTDKVRKEYLAVVRPRNEQAMAALRPGVWQELSDYLLKEGRLNLSKVVAPGTPGAKASRLSYRVEGEKTSEAGERLFLLRIRLRTGRHHQIRVQFNHLSLPLFGDKKYGSDMGSPEESLALCAVSLTFPHPVNGKEMSFSLAPENPAFQGFTPYSS